MKSHLKGGVDMSTIGERIKGIRKEAGLTQQKFAERIGAKQNTVAQYEIGRNVPIDPVITAICKEFDIQKDWLRYGLEPMRAARSREEEIAELVGSALVGSNEFKKAVIKMICSRNDAELKALEDALRAVYENIQKEKSQD
jgi:transcriptional regulator with XRE-family HTH domain